MRIGFVGAGRMGRPVVRRLVQAGHELRVLARSADTRDALAREGVRVAADLPDVAHDADVVLVCVHTDEQVRAVCLDGGLDGGLTGGTVVVHTTGSPHTAEAIARRGWSVVDAPFSGGPHDVAAGRVTLFVGGDDETVARVGPVLSCYGDPVLHVGPLGAGQRVKLINNALFAAHIGLLDDAVRLGTQLGVPEQVLVEALQHGSAASRALSGVASRGSVAAFNEAVREFVGKDVDIVRRLAAELGGDLGAIEGALAVSH